MSIKMQILVAVMLAAVAGLFVDSALGQALPAAGGPGLYVSAGASVSAFQVQYGQRMDYGFAGVAELHTVGRVGVQAEVRSLRYHTDEGVTQTTFLVGPQAYVLRHGPLRPYVKLLVGDAHMRFPFGYATGDYFAVAPGGGIDFKILPAVTLRLADVEYQSWTHFTFGAMHPYGISTGIQIRVTRPNVFRKDPYVFDE